MANFGTHNIAPFPWEANLISNFGESPTTLYRSRTSLQLRLPLHDLPPYPEILSPDANVSSSSSSSSSDASSSFLHSPSPEDSGLPNQFLRPIARRNHAAASSRANNSSNSNASSDAAAGGAANGAFELFPWIRERIDDYEMKSNLFEFMGHDLLELILHQSLRYFCNVLQTNYNCLHNLQALEQIVILLRVSAARRQLQMTQSNPQTSQSSQASQQCKQEMEALNKNMEQWRDCSKRRLLNDVERVHQVWQKYEKLLDKKKKLKEARKNFWKSMPIPTPSPDTSILPGNGLNGGNGPNGARLGKLDKYDKLDGFDEAFDKFGKFDEFDNSAINMELGATGMMGDLMDFDDFGRGGGSRRNQRRGAARGRNQTQSGNNTSSDGDSSFNLSVAYDHDVPARKRRKLMEIGEEDDLEALGTGGSRRSRRLNQQQQQRRRREKLKQMKDKNERKDKSFDQVLRERTGEGKKPAETGNIADANQAWNKFLPLFEFHGPEALSKLLKIGFEIENGRKKKFGGGDDARGTRDTWDADDGKEENREVPWGKMNHDTKEIDTTGPTVPLPQQSTQFKNKGRGRRRRMRGVFDDFPTLPLDGLDTPFDMNVGGGMDEMAQTGMNVDMNDPHCGHDSSHFYGVLPNNYEYYANSGANGANGSNAGSHFGHTHNKNIINSKGSTREQLDNLLLSNSNFLARSSFLHATAPDMSLVNHSFDQRYLSLLVQENCPIWYFDRDAEGNNWRTFANLSDARRGAEKSEKSKKKGSAAAAAVVAVEPKFRFKTPETGGKGLDLESMRRRRKRGKNTLEMCLRDEVCETFFGGDEGEIDNIVARGWRQRTDDECYAMIRESELDCNSVMTRHFDMIKSLKERIEKGRYGKKKSGIETFLKTSNTMASIRSDAWASGRMKRSHMELNEELNNECSTDKVNGSFKKFMGKPEESLKILIMLHQQFSNVQDVIRVVSGKKEKLKDTDRSGSNNSNNSSNSNNSNNSAGGNTSGSESSNAEEGQESSEEDDDLII